jgi:hypothetical protein
MRLAVGATAGKCGHDDLLEGVHHYSIDQLNYNGDASGVKGRVRNFVPGAARERTETICSAVAGGWRGVGNLQVPIPRLNGAR